MKRYRLVLLLIVISIGMILFSEKGIKKLKMYFNQSNKGKNDSLENGSIQENEQIKSDKIDFTIVIDAGHGGYDPGKVGVNGANEKDINLSISIKLRDMLEKKGINVIMTREKDEALCSTNETYKKSTDMINRVKIIEDSKADITVSIHQNSFTSSSSKGAQVFYYNNSEKSRQLADLIQETMKAILADGNQRLAKANDTYYLLRKTSCPIVIIECGFLSNPAEADLLADDAYQNKAAEAICEGIMKYYNNFIKNKESIDDVNDNNQDDVHNN